MPPSAKTSPCRCCCHWLTRRSFDYAPPRRAAACGPGGSDRNAPLTARRPAAAGAAPSSPRSSPPPRPPPATPAPPGRAPAARRLQQRAGWRAVKGGWVGLWVGRTAGRVGGRWVSGRVREWSAAWRAKHGRLSSRESTVLHGARGCQQQSAAGLHACPTEHKPHQSAAVGRVQRPTHARMHARFHPPHLQPPPHPKQQNTAALQRPAHPPARLRPVRPPGRRSHVPALLQPPAPLG